LSIEQTVYDEVRRHGEDAYPREACGVLLGRVEGDRRAVARSVRCKNTVDDVQRDRYAIDPRDLLSLQREGRAHGQEIVGFYHSHPEHVAYWSATDLREAHWIGCSYLITSVRDRKAEDTRSFVLEGAGEEDKRFTEEDLCVGVSAMPEAGA
jgi:proteasome lid subunit RPN8/RPN11